LLVRIAQARLLRTEDHHVRRLEVVMTKTLNEEGMDSLFRAARTYNEWLDKPVSDHTLRQLYGLMKWGPTSANSCPARILFLRTPEAKARLLPALAQGNIAKTQAAPVTAIIASSLMRPACFCNSDH
jgi:3-hydroxypropanoate dehydrogenase